MRVLYVGVAALLAASGCSRGENAASTTATPADPNTERAVAAASVANAMAANPSAADSILVASGYTRDGFQSLMYEIAVDSAMSAAYAAAKTR